MAIFRVDVEQLRWSHSSIFDHFGHENGAPGISVFETIVQLLEGLITPDDLPAIEVSQLGSHLYCLSNRRLFALKRFQKIRKRFNPDSPPLEVQVKLASRCSCDPRQKWMFTTENDGKAVELLRPCNLSFDKAFRLQRFCEPERGFETQEEPTYSDDESTPCRLLASENSVCSDALLQYPTESLHTPYDPEELAVTAVCLPSLGAVLCVYCHDISAPFFQRASALAEKYASSVSSTEEFAEDSLYESLTAALAPMGPPWDQDNNWHRLARVSLGTQSFCAIGVGTARKKHERALKLAIAVSAFLHSARQCDDVEFGNIAFRARSALEQCSAQFEQTDAPELSTGDADICVCTATVAIACNDYLGGHGYLRVREGDRVAVFNEFPEEPGDPGDAFSYRFAMLITVLGVERTGWVPAHMLSMTTEQCFLERNGAAWKVR